MERRKKWAVEMRSKHAKFNESSLVDKHHQNLRQAKSLMRDLDLERRFKETPVLGIDKSDEELVSHDSSTNLARSRNVRDDQKLQITKDHKKPPAEFHRTPQNDPYDPRLDLSPIFPGLHAPPSVRAQSPSPDPIPPRHLLSLRNSIFPDLMVPQSLLSVNGPGRYVASFSDSPSSTRTKYKRPSVITQSPSPEPFPTVTLKNSELRSGLPYPGYLLSPRDSFFPHRMVPQNLLSINGPGRYIASFFDSPSSNKTKYKRPSVIAQSPSLEPIPPVTLKNSEVRSGRPYPGHRLNPSNSIYPEPVVPRVLLSVYGPGRYISSVSYSPSSTRTTSERPQVLYKEAPLRVRFHDENSRNSPRLTTPSRTIDVNPKTWLGEIAHKILKVSDDHTALSQSRGRSTVPAPPRMAQARQHTLSTGTANTTQPFIEDKDGFLSKPTIAGDVLYGKIQVSVPTTLPPKRIAYNNEMKRLNEGYLVFFFIEMCRLISMKNKTEVLQALNDMETIYDKSWASGHQVQLIVGPLEKVIRNMLKVPPGKYGVAETQARAAMMSRLLQERRHVLSPEVNSIIDQVEMVYKDEDGERLLYSLEQFEDFSNTNKSSYEICEALMENILLPFRHEPLVEQLLDTINRALQERVPHFLSGSHEGTVTSSAKFNNTSLTALLQQSIHEIDTLLRDFQQDIQKEKLWLRTDSDEKGNFKEEEQTVRVFDYNRTPYWWHGNDTAGQNTPDVPHWWHGISGNDTARQNIPDATFLPTPEGFGVTDSPTAASTNNLWTRLNSLSGVFYDPPRLTSYKVPPGFVFASVFPPELPFNSPRPSLTTFDYHDGTLEPVTTKEFEVSSSYHPSPEETSPATAPSLMEDPTAPTLIEGTIFYDPPRSTPYKVPPGFVFASVFPPELPFNSPGPSLTTFDYHDGTLEPVTTKDLEVSSSYHPSPEETSPATAPSLIEVTIMPFASVHPPILPPRPITISKYLKKLRNTNMKVGKARTGDTPVQKRVQGIRITPKPRPLARTLSKAQAWVQNRRWTSNPTPSSSTSASSLATARALRTKSRATLSTNNVDRFTTDPKSFYASPNKPFHDIMNATDEGYVVVFVGELSKRVALKEENDMQQVIKHAEPIVNRLLQENRLRFAGRQIETAAKKLSQMLTNGYFDAGPLKSSAVFLRLLLNERETTLSPEANELLDYTDMLLNDARGESLFDALRDFEEFPNTTNTAYQICYNLLTRFIEPFRILPKTERGQALLDSINKALLDRFGKRKVGYKRWGGELTGATPKLDISRLKNRYTPSLKRRISKRRRELNRTRNEEKDDSHRRQYYYQTPWIPILRSMLPITRHQKRFRVITPRQLWTNVNSNERRTQDYRRRLSRPTHPPNDMMQFFPRVRMEKKGASRSPPPMVAASLEKHSKQALAKPLKRSINHRRPRRLKATLFRRSSKTQKQK